MPRIRSLIVDDEPLARARITELLARESDIEVIDECANGTDAVNAIVAEEPDLVDRIVARTIDPYSAAAQIFERSLKDKR